MNDQVREAFEKRMRAQFGWTDYLLRREGDRYKFASTDGHWEDFKAAYSAGLSAGREQALEQAARECQMLHAIHSRHSGLEPDCAGLIRALGATQPEVK